MRRIMVAAGTAAALAFPGGSEAATIHVTTAEDVVAADGSCSLREAIRSANTDSAGSECDAGDAAVDVITLPGAGPYNLTRTGAGEDAAETGDLDLASGGPLQIEGPVNGTATISAAGLDDRVFDVLPDARVNLLRLTIRDATTGSGIRNAGALAVVDSVVTANTGAPGPSGGAVGGTGTAGGIQSSGPLSVIGSLLSHNTGGAGGSADSVGGGGGVGGLASETELTVTDTTLSDNTGGVGGFAQAVGGNGGVGGLRAQGPMTLTRVSATHNDGGAGGAAPAGSTGIAGPGGAGGVEARTTATIDGGRIATNSAGKGGAATYGGTGGVGGLSLANGLRSVTLTVRGTDVEENQGGTGGSGTQFGGGGGVGGVSSNSPVTLEKARIAKNTGGAKVGGITAGGAGGLSATGPVTVTDSELVDNVGASSAGSPAAGGVGQLRATGGLTLRGSSVTGGAAGAPGSIQTDQVAGVTAGGPVDIQTTRITDNTGGYALTITGADAVVRRTTVTGSAGTAALRNRGTGLLVDRSTLGAAGNGVPYRGENNSTSSLDHVTLSASGAVVAVAGNATVSATASLFDGSCPAAVTGTNDIAKTGSGCPGAQAAPLELGPLTDNGGPAPTFLPGAGSPAIDAAGQCTDVDARGVARPQGSACDAGAVERQFTRTVAGAASFGDVALGADAERAVSVTYSGEPTTLGAATATGPFSVVGSACSDVVTGAVCTVTVRFTPIVLGAADGTLTLEGAAGTIALDGTGVPAPVAPAPTAEPTPVPTSEPAPTQPAAVTPAPTASPSPTARAAAGLKAKVRARRRGRRTAMTVTGSVRRPRTATAAEACTGKVTVTIRRPGKKPVSATGRVRATCRFTIRKQLKGRPRKLTATVAFAGNRVLKPARTKRLKP